MCCSQIKQWVNYASHISLHLFSFMKHRVSHRPTKNIFFGDHEANFYSQEVEYSFLGSYSLGHTVLHFFHAVSDSFLPVCIYRIWPWCVCVCVGVFLCTLGLTGLPSPTFAWASTWWARTTCWRTSEEVQPTSALTYWVVRGHAGARAHTDGMRGERRRKFSISLSQMLLTNAKHNHITVELKLPYLHAYFM